MSKRIDPPGTPTDAAADQGSAPYTPPAHKAILASAPSFFIPPPFGWRHPVTGRKGWQPDPELIAFGMYVKRARYLANVTQHRLEQMSGVDQGQLSRLERALAPWTKVEDLVKISGALGRAMPLGYCPHEHWCAWQPAPPPPMERPLGWLPPALQAVADAWKEEEAHDGGSVEPAAGP
jgi:transcriptional regulator with XRE-family HTH domain